MTPITFEQSCKSRSEIPTVGGTYPGFEGGLRLDGELSGLN